MSSSPAMLLRIPLSLLMRYVSAQNTPSSLQCEMNRHLPNDMCLRRQARRILGRYFLCSGCFGFFLLIDIPNDSDVKVSCERVLGVGEEAGHDGGSVEPLERIFLGFLGGFGGPLFRFLLLLGRLRRSDDESSETRQLPENWSKINNVNLTYSFLFSLYSRIFTANNFYYEQFSIFHILRFAVTYLIKRPGSSC